MKERKMKLMTTQGKETLVDKGILPLLSAYKWRYHTRTGYIHTTTKDRKDLFMHRLIVNAPTGMQVDHINGNKLDNRKSNLRICTHSENQRNAGIRKDNTSGYKGVYFDKRNGRYKAQIQTNGKQKSIGYFDTPLEAAQAYDREAKRIFGRFAKLNFDADNLRQKA